MSRFKKLAHAVWECKYHVVWCPKYRFRILSGEVGRFIREIIRQLCEWKQVEILEGNVQKDHIHLVLSVPPKYSIAETIGFIKGKSAIKAPGAEAAVLGAALLGEGILREHGRTG